MSRKMCALVRRVKYAGRVEYIFNPTAGIPKTSYNEKSSPTTENITWFSTIQSPNEQETPPQ